MCYVHSVIGYGATASQTARALARGPPLLFWRATRTCSNNVVFRISPDAAYT
ncbi:hypothetical protein BDZ89DRAFT_1075735 [Hymenopellis radicata]|nr:hypothetical protein BDZ89DRAFT_1075735 [Hymenopellis radicata]